MFVTSASYVTINNSRYSDEYVDRNNDSQYCEVTRKCASAIFQNTTRVD